MQPAHANNINQNIQSQRLAAKCQTFSDLSSAGPLDPVLLLKPASQTAPPSVQVWCKNKDKHRLNFNEIPVIKVTLKMHINI